MALGRASTPRALAAAGLLVACGTSATALPTPQLQTRYLAAANAYNSAEAVVLNEEDTACAATSTDFAGCKAALQRDRAATVEFDSRLRAIPFPSGIQAAASKLLSDDSQLESTLARAASAASLIADAPVFARLAQLYSATNQDAQAVRAALGLPGSSQPATATPSPS